MRLNDGKLSGLSKRLSPRALFFAIAAGAELITLILLFATGGRVLSDLLFFDRHDTFMDYFNPLMTFDQFSPSELYSDAKTFYPPLSMLFYFVMYSLIPSDMALDDGFAARASQITLFPYCIYLLLTVLAVACAVSAYGKGEKKERTLLVLTALLSFPMLYQLERGNILILAFLFTLLFIFLSGSESRGLRELGLVCLAIAAGLKVYPALFGVILLTEKRYKEAVRCVLYGIAAFLLPALFFGGVSISDMLGALANMSNGVSSEGYGYKVNFSNTLSFFSAVMGVEFSRAAMNAAGLVIGAIAFVAIFIQKQNWKRLCLIAIIIAGVPSVSYVYVMIFMIIPITAFLNETRDKPRCPSDYVYAVMLAACIAPLPFSGIAYSSAVGYPMSASVLTESIAIILLAVALAADGCICTVRAVKGRRASGKAGAKICE